MLINSPIRNRTRVSRFKVSSDNHYTIGEVVYLTHIPEGIAPSAVRTRESLRQWVLSPPPQTTRASVLGCNVSHPPTLQQNAIFLYPFQVYTIVFYNFISRSSSNKKFKDIFRSAASGGGFTIHLRVFCLPSNTRPLLL